jgi:hypothetical protein
MNLVPLFTSAVCIAAVCERNSTVVVGEPGAWTADYVCDRLLLSNLPEPTDTVAFTVRISCWRRTTDTRYHVLFDDGRCYHGTREVSLS